MGVARRPGGTTSVLSRLLLVVAVTLGLSAMHVLAAAVAEGHAAVHDSVSAESMPGAEHSALVSPAQTTTLVQVPGTDHQHHHATGDCVLFLSAGVALLVVLIAWAAARALRPSYVLTEPLRGAVVVTTPWRGPPPWHWPRTSLCVIRVQADRSRVDDVVRALLRRAVHP